MDKPAFLYSSYGPAASVTATDSYAGTVPADVLDFNEAHFWRPADISGDKQLSFDLADARAIGHLALVGQGLDGVSLTIEASEDNWSTSETLVADVILESKVNAAWVSLDSRTWRYIRLTFSSFPSTFRVAFASLGQGSSLPWLASDWDPDNISETGDVSVSPAGLFLGTIQHRTMRSLTIELGSITPTEYVEIRRWAIACQQNRSPFFFVPDVSSKDVYYGWIDRGTFSAPLKNGLREVQQLTMITRGA